MVSPERPITILIYQNTARWNVTSVAPFRDTPMQAYSTAILAAADTNTKLIGCGVCLAIGVYMVVMGYRNVKTRTAGETVKQRIRGAVRGREQVVQTGGKAVYWGVSRIVLGIIFIIAG